MNYDMGGTILRKTVKEKDRVTMNANMKVGTMQNWSRISITENYKERRLIVPQ